MDLSKEDASDKEVCSILTPLKYSSHSLQQFIKMLWMDKLPSTGCFPASEEAGNTNSQTFPKIRKFRDRQK